MIDTSIDRQQWITPRVAAQKYLMVSIRTVDQMCLMGVFPSAHKPGLGKRGHWKILRSDVLAHRYNRHKRDI